MNVLAVGISREIELHLVNASRDLSFRRISTLEQLESLDEEDHSQTADTIFCGSSFEQLNVLEMAQTVRLLFPKGKIVFLTNEADNLRIKTLVKNGFSHCFVLPFDQNRLQAEISAIEMITASEESKFFQAVKLVDIKPDTVMPFSVTVFLPMNKKFIKMIKKGDVFSEQKVNKLKEKCIGTVYIDKRELDAFYSYCAERLADCSPNNEKMSETERKMKVEEHLHVLFSSIFDESESTTDFEVGKELMEQTQKIIERYVLRESKIDLQELMQRVLGDSNDTYSHSSSVSTIAFMFGLYLEYPRPSDLAIAGLFHDIGMVGISDDLSKMSRSEMEIYQSHPAKSVNLLRKKRINVPEEIARMILQHHERHDGKGFPGQFVSSRIDIGAQILSLADQIEYMTRLKEGSSRITAVEAINQIFNNNSITPEVLVPIRRFILKSKPTQPPIQQVQHG